MIPGLLIGMVSLVIVVVDIMLYGIKGREATVSRLLQRWSWDAHPLVMIILGLIIGGLLTHFFGFEP